MAILLKACKPVMEVECLGIGAGLVGGDIFDFGEGFVTVVVEMEVDDLKLQVGGIVRLLWSCMNWELYFLWLLSRMSLEKNVECRMSIGN